MYLEMLELLLIVGGFLALFIGILLYVKPEKVAALSKSGNSWYSSRKRTKPLDIIRDTDTFYFNNNQLIGTIMILFSILAIYLIYLRIPMTDEYMSIVGNDASSLGIGILLESLRWVLLIAISFGIPLWGMLAFAPDRLKKVNSYLNKWISTRMLLLPLEQMNDSFDTFVIQNNRIFGAVFVLGAAFILFNFLG